MNSPFLFRCGSTTPSVQCVPSYHKFSAEAFELWMQEIRKFVSRGETKVYAENALQEIYPLIQMAPLDIGGLFCQEVDTSEDLLKVRDYLFRTSSRKD